MPMPIVDHEFGNRSTNLKLSVVEQYLRQFTTALQHKFKELWYIDAFAGTGERVERLEAHDGNLFDPASAENVARHRGSAKIAMDITPPFHRLFFIEKNPKHCEALRLLRDAHPNRDIRIMNGGADEEIRKLLTRRSWTSIRAVMFLDPCGMSVSWETLQLIKSTRAIDVWYLVSLAGLFRQATKDWSAIDEGKRAAITRMLGTDEWERVWYEPIVEPDLFGTPDEQHHRTADVDQIEEFVQQRLEKLFPKVLKPLRLKNDRGVPMFALFFAISNERPAAIRVATDIANHILNAGRSSHKRPR